MDKESIRSELTREPFVPLRLYITNGRTFDVPFRQAAHMVYRGVLVFIGANLKKHTARGYDRFAYEQIEKIEPLPTKPSRRRRRKAS